MAARAVPAPLAAIPNVLTIGRLILIPVFVPLLLTSDGGHSWAAAIVFGIAGVTDQIDGWLPRRRRGEARVRQGAPPPPPAAGGSSPSSARSPTRSPTA